MSIVGTTLMKRGLQAHAFISEKKDKIDIPPWVLVMLIITSVAFVYCLFMIEYTFGRVIPTLLMIESPQENIGFEPLPTEDDNGMVKDPEPVTSQPQYITSSFRRSIELLKAHGGYRGRFRGLPMYIANNLAVQWVAGTFSVMTGRFFPREFYIVPAYVISAQLSLGWTLIVITESSPKYWFRRIPSFQLWKKVAGPTALYSLVEQLVFMIPVILLLGAGIDKDPKEIANMPLNQQKLMIAKIYGIAILSLVLSLGLVAPAKVILTRIQASLVSESEETIVPFDRTFGGKVVPEILGGTGMVGICDAWTTFDWHARIRLVKAYLKATAMIFATSVFFSIILITQIILFAPEAHKSLAPSHGN